MSNRALSQRNVLLGITGSIAAYKACDLVRKLKASGAAVQVIMTANARRLLSEAAMACLSGNEVLTEQFSSGSTTLAHHVVLGELAHHVVLPMTLCRPRSSPPFQRWSSPPRCIPLCTPIL